MTSKIWVLGATGRSARGIAERLHGRGAYLVLGARDPARVNAIAAMPTLCPALWISMLLKQHKSAVSRGTTIVTGAGFGVLATETLVVKMCAQWPDPTRVRVDAIPSLAVEDGVIGIALAGSILDGLPDGGRRMDAGKLVRSPIAATPIRWSRHRTWFPAELLCGFSCPLFHCCAASPFFAGSPFSRLAKVRMRAKEMPRQFSWGHSEMEWQDGTKREAWLRLPDAQEFTNAAVAEIAHRLQIRTCRPGRTRQQPSSGHHLPSTSAVPL